MRDNIVGTAEELMDSIYKSRDLAKIVKEKIQNLEEKLNSGTVSTLVSQELEKIVTKDFLRSFIERKLTDELIRSIITSYLVMKENYITDLVSEYLTTWISSNKDTVVSDVIRSEIDSIFNEEADTYYQEVARALIDNKLFQELLHGVVSDVTSKKIEDKLELIEKLLMKKKTIVKKKKSSED